ncbi:SAM-dependent methyltransferase [Actinosynnema sp. NPDC023587]|uniref:SAM-dependent methyltransferase n=1 Tax=Actinosynnema sp. NPDC023587 TaxID=3154695 RepID=UPI003400A052
MELDGIEHGVGVTALMVAAARAIEHHRPDALAHDGFAEHFVRAAEVSRTWPVRPQDVPDGDAHPVWGRLARYFGLRTRVLDDFTEASADAGAHQVVLLGAGLDSRAYRLRWPAGSTVFEVDRAAVLEFKQGVLREMRATPEPVRTPVAADLRLDWARALLDAGFDPARPTTWLAEGLLLYLPAAAEEALIARVDRLSAPGSRCAYEIKSVREVREFTESPVYRLAKEEIGVDLLALFDDDARPDSAAALAARGWTTTTRTPFHYTALHGRGPLPQPCDALATNLWVFAVKDV